MLPAPEAELEASCKELDEKVTWLLHNSRKMDNYLELEPFSKDGRLCAHVCDTLKSLPETPTLATYKDYKAIIILLGMSTTHYAILDELAEQHRKRDEIPELTAYCDALHWMRPGRQYLCNVYNTVCHALISALRMCKIIQAFRKRFLCPLQTVPVRSKEKMIGVPS